MKILLLLLFIVGCEQGSEASNETTVVLSDGNSSVAVVVDPVEFVVGQYESACIQEGSDFYYYSLAINDNYTVTYAKMKSIDDACGAYFSFLVGTWDINGDNELVYKNTIYRYLAGGYSFDGTYICGLDYMEQGVPYEIDGLGCSESFENKSFSVSRDGDTYTINGVELFSF